MSRRLIVRPEAEAEADITDASLWYEEREAALGLEFTLEVRNAIRRAVCDPLLQLRLRREPEVRRILTRRFPYRIFFLVPEDFIVVFAGLYAARHDRRWRQRF